MMNISYMSSTLIVLLLAPFMVSLGISSSNFTDQLALLAFKSRITFDPSNVLENSWTEKSNFCDWAGVSCSRRRQRVTSLNLKDMGLHGTISPHVGNLSFLMVFNLVNNNFSGYVPQELGHLRRLVDLNWRGNQIEGQIPTALQHCQKLQYLSLGFNRLTGPIPTELATLRVLNVLYLEANNLTGTIPPSLSNMSNLEELIVGRNNIYGNIPREIGKIPKLKKISFAKNSLTGSIPEELFNNSLIQQVSFSINDIGGTLPLRTILPNLNNLVLDGNHISGEIPLILSNSSMINVLALGYNNFTGSVPTYFGQFPFLKILRIAGNKLTGELERSELKFLTTLTNCTNLQYLNIADNPLLSGVFPESIGNLSSSLSTLLAYSIQINGHIPRGIGSLISLNTLVLHDNNLDGIVPSTIAGIETLQALYLDVNEIEGSIPNEICLMKNLGVVSISYNKLLGPIPDCIGNLSHLQELLLNNNLLNSPIPLSSWNLTNLFTLNLSNNSLGGNIDEIEQLKVLVSFDLSWNQISGVIPNTIGSFESLSSLNLSQNSFQGNIPETIRKLVALEYLDLSHNNLSGTIPKSLEALIALKFLNLSSNKLYGEIPTGGIFKNLTFKSFLDNAVLCGQPNLQVLPCKIRRTSRKPWRKIVLGSILGAVAIMAIFIAGVCTLVKYKRKNLQSQPTSGDLSSVEWRKFSYLELCAATNNFSEANLLGEGAFGKVYMATLSDGEIVAMKILNLMHDGAFKSFDAECRVLRTVRHRNLVRVISSCSNLELRALVLEYMPNGSLYKWLYSHNYCLNLFQRVNIMLDVALGVEYLHHGNSEVVVHCDLKPRNVLLDEDMVAHVGDFGIAKILAESQTTMQTKTLGTIGYIAPEYGSEGTVSRKGDMYSYGVLLLETFTRKPPTDEMFSGESTLRDWVKASFPNNIMEVIDRGLLDTQDGGDLVAMQGYLLAIIELGLHCSAEFSGDRIDIINVVIQLNKIKALICSSGHA